MATPSPGGTKLSDLIRSMDPTLHQGTFVYATVPDHGSEPERRDFLSRVAPEAEMFFRESEGLTLILAQEKAEELHLERNFPSRKITLNVHSSLDAVGFLAAITTRLATKLEIGVNPVSGYYHDHLFVAVGNEDLVMEELRAMEAEQH